MKRVLFPTDFSPHANAALPHAINLAALQGGELHLLHVVVLHSATAPPLEEFSGEKEAREALDGLQTGESRVVHAVRRAVAASPAILEYAEENDIDVIVMGSHGRRGFRRLLLGSVAEEVIRAGHWPVMTVRHDTGGASGNPNFARILAPVDFSAQSAAGVEVAADLAGRFAAELHLLHVIDVPVMPEFYGPVVTPGVDVKEATDRAATRMGEIVGALGADLSIRTDIRVGGAVHEILEAAEKDIDLIVVPTHGYSGWDRALLGSVAEGVLRRAHCPVLTLKLPVS